LDAPPPNPHFVKEPKFLGNPRWQKYSARLDQELKILERFDGQAGNKRISFN
jgi:hypothetical protein